MEGIKIWITAVAVTSVMASIVYILAPKGSTQKIVRISVFTFILTSSIASFMSQDIDLEFKLPELEYKSYRQERLLDNIQESMESLIVKNMNNILKSMGVEGANIKITTDKKEDNSIVITETLITVPEKYKKMSEQIKTKIKKELGYDVRVGI
ncbi:MAG: hypothetical protein IJD88_03415 [Clostridia bacterium]|nr:hypothetical protein [Clostridia bacterium]